MWYTGLPLRHGLPKPIVVCTTENTCSKALWLQSLSYTFFHWSRPHVGLATPAFLRGWVSSIQFQQNWLIGGHVFLWRNWYVMNHFTMICVYNLSNTSEVLCFVWELHQLNWAPNSSTICCFPIFKCTTFGYQLISMVCSLPWSIQFCKKDNFAGLWKCVISNTAGHVVRNSRGHIWSNWKSCSNSRGNPLMFLCIAIRCGFENVKSN